MQKLYEDLRDKVDKYRCEGSIERETALIDSLDNFVNAKSFDSIVGSNDYRNKVLIVLNECLYGLLINLPDSYNQFEILIHKFFNNEVRNPYHDFGRLLRLDLEKDEDDRDFTNEEWDDHLDYLIRLMKFWNGYSHSTVKNLYDIVFEKYPRTNILKHLDYGLNPQYLDDLEESFVDIMTKSTYLEEAEDSLSDKLDIQQIYQLKYFEPEVYAEILSDEIDFLETGIEPVKIVIVDTEGQEAVD